MTTDRIDRLNNVPINSRPIRPAGPVQPGTASSPGAAGSAPGATFQEILAGELASPELLRFSAHAQARITARRMNLGDEELSRLAVGVNKAAAKGARESLVLVDDKAFVVSIRNRTVITAVDGENMKENVFTNIDSAVIV
jgi:flagellar operon protein